MEYLMQHPEQAAADLAFVRQNIERRKAPPYAPLSLASLWAVIIMGGCVIYDFVPRFAWMYWSIMPSIGFFLSWLMGAKHVLRMGEYDVAKSVRSGWHWGSLFLAAAPL